jgi:hypothetical protein
MSSVVDWIDSGIDALLAIDPTMTAFTRHDLANVLGSTPDEVSWALQEHRKAHGKRYTVACRGYGLAAQWVVLNRPGRALVGDRARLLGQLDHVAEDAWMRLTNDLNLEVRRLAPRHPSITAFLDAETQALYDSMRVANRRVDRFIANVAAQGVNASTSVHAVPKLA